jgi:hypothetical protein
MLNSRLHVGRHKQIARARVGDRFAVEPVRRRMAFRTYSRSKSDRTLAWARKSSPEGPLRSEPLRGPRAPTISPKAEVIIDEKLPRDVQATGIGAELQHLASFSRSRVGDPAVLADVFQPAKLARTDRRRRLEVWKRPLPGERLQWRRVGGAVGIKRHFAGDIGNNQREVARGMWVADG